MEKQRLSKTDYLGNEYETLTDMCSRYNIEVPIYVWRVQHNWSVERALTTKSYHRKQCCDHLGNEFDTQQEMCEHWGISVLKYIRRRDKGWDLKQILETPNVRGNISFCKDPLGNKFISIKEMCKHYNISTSTYRMKKANGVSLTDILKVDKKSRRVQDIIDHKGNTFINFKELCKHYNIGRGTYDSRMRLGWSLKDTLEIPVNNKGFKSKDHNGKVYNTRQQMADYWKISIAVLDKRLAAGWELKKALTTPVKKAICIDHLGIEYNSFKSMCNAYELSDNSVRSRLRTGMSLEEALTTEVKKIEHTDKIQDVKNIDIDKTCTDHLNREFSSMSEMCREYKIPFSSFQGRISRGWTIDKALTTPLKRYKNKSVPTKIDHLGNKFFTVDDMLLHWNISRNTYRGRRERGWELKDILETPKLQEQR